MRITNNIDYATLRSAIEGVEDNNKINDGKWSNWDDAAHVEDVYEVKLCPQGVKIVNEAIDTNGTSLPAALAAVSAAVWGEDSPSSFFWDRS